jgi:hypothetical protein
MNYLVLLVLMTTIIATSIACPPEFTYQGAFPTIRMCNRGYPTPNCRKSCIVHANLQLAAQYIDYHCGYEKDNVRQNHYICCCKFEFSYGYNLPDLGPNLFIS